MPDVATEHGAPEALLFPGQGSQTPDMREAVERHRPELLELCRVEVGRDPFESLDQGTRFLQPALYCASVALWAGAGSPVPKAIAGHSLGELAALAAAAVISEADGLRLAAVRGRVMQEVAEAAGEGGMAAILGGSDNAMELAHRHGLTIANDNAPGQIVISGPVAELEAASVEAKASGLKVRRLPIAGAFHSPAMAPAVERFGEALSQVEMRPSRAVVYSGVSAGVFADYRGGLAEALTKPVRWRETLLAMEGDGIRRFVEVGPGKVLKGLARRTVPDCETATLAELEVARA